jgi:hypothetical protein
MEHKNLKFGDSGRYLTRPNIQVQSLTMWHNPKPLLTAMALYHCCVVRQPLLWDLSSCHFLVDNLAPKICLAE